MVDNKYSPTLQRDCSYTAKDLGFSLGICTIMGMIGVSMNKKLMVFIKKDIVELFDWVRLGMYGFYEGYALMT